MTEAYFHGCCPRTLEDIGDERGRKYRMHQTHTHTKRTAPHSSLAYRGGGDSDRFTEDKRDNEDRGIMEVNTTMSRPAHDTLKQLRL